MEEKRVNESEGGSVDKGSISNEEISIKDDTSHMGMKMEWNEWWV